MSRIVQGVSLAVSVLSVVLPKVDLVHLVPLLNKELQSVRERGIEGDSNKSKVLRSLLKEETDLVNLAFAPACNRYGHLAATNVAVDDAHVLGIILQDAQRSTQG